jgi:peptide/nickel transport system substrate-binding protein
VEWNIPRRVVLTVAAVLVSGMTLAGCTGSPDGSGNDESTELVDFVYAAPALPDTTDPALDGALPAPLTKERSITAVLFEGVSVEAGACKGMSNVSQLSPSLFESWSQSDDGKVVTLTLREGVLSSAGNEFTSADFVWSIERTLALVSSANFLTKVISVWADSPVTVVDDHTVELHVDDPGSLDVALFTQFRWAILDSTVGKAEATKEDPWAVEFFSSNSADFGPWQFTSADWQPGEELVMHRNPNYFDQESLGNIGRLIMRVIPEGSTRAQLLRTGEVDFASQLAPSEYASLRTDASVQVFECDGADRDGLFLNQSDERFADLKVRQAISYAIDREELVQAAYDGAALPATDGLNQSYGFPEPESRFEFDPEKAKALLAEAGYPDGFATEIAYGIDRPGPQAEQEAINIASQLAKVGIEASLRVIASPAEFQSAYLDGTYQMMIQTEPPAIPDASYASGLYSSCGGFQNSYGYCNERYDELTSEIRRTAPGPERDQLMAEISSLIVETIPVVYLVDSRVPRAFAGNIDLSTYNHQPDYTNIMAHRLIKQGI